MSVWVLIWFIAVGENVSTSSAEFSSQTSCETAAATIKKVAGKGSIGFNAYCVQK